MRSKLIIASFVAFPVVGWLVLGGGGKVEMPELVQQEYEQLPDQLDYNIHVKPILSDKCFACHGPDAAKQKAELRLDDAAAAYGKVTESGLKAIVPGNPAKSEIIQRILSSDPEVVMPTPESHLSLNDKEKATLIKWVEDGAEYKPHWAFVAPRKPTVPQPQGKEWAKTAIDHFVLDKMQEQGLEPSTQADRETLLRRVAFDLTGLPPTPQEIKSFVEDKSPRAYEAMVDRYLSSPHYGERMAAYWLDVARFADSYGYLDDKHRDATPWRDWVISAYNRNLPFDKFITWQLAGDLLPNATQEQILATGFNRNHKQNSEAGIIDEEFRVEYVHDRTSTLGTGLLGLSIKCAQCHDHKYDPVSAKDYYSLFAFFNSTLENGSPNIGDSGILPGPTLLLTTPQQEKEMKRLRGLISALEQQKKKKVVSAPQPELLASRVAGWLRFDEITRGTAYHSVFSKTPDKPYISDVFPNQADRRYDAEAGKYLFSTGVRGKALKMEEETFVHFPPYRFAYFERYQPFAFSFWVKLAKRYDEAYVFHHSDAKRMGNLGYDLLIVDGKLNFRLSHSYPHDALSVATRQKIDTGKWVHVSVSYDGSSRAAGVQFFIDGVPARQDIWADRLLKSIRSRPNIHKSPYPFEGLVFGKRYLEKVIIGSELDDFVVFDGALSAAEAGWLFRNQQDLEPYLTRRVRKAKAAGPDSLMAVRQQLALLIDTTRETMVMGDLPKPRPTYVLNRGVYSERGERVTPGTPASILPFDPEYPKNRLGLARWLFDERHPLTARVAVNRIWELIFGRGLVKTTDDFGNQGEMPSHPELLDYLAVWYRENGWDTKALQKMILMSATYQQEAKITPALLAADPQNKWLARSPRYRMPAEMIRDNALASAGLLVKKTGGPSTYPYQPAGLWDQLSDKVWRYQYREATTDEVYRRSVYTFVKRTSLPPSMQIFDFPDRNSCVVKRPVSSSPLQALVLMNDPQYVEAARFMAWRSMTEAGAKSQAQITYLYQLATGRLPRSNELQLLKKMYESSEAKYASKPEKALLLLDIGISKTPVPPAQVNTLAAMTDVAMALINTDEFTTRK